MPAPTLKDLLVRIRALEAATVKLIAASEAPKKEAKAAKAKAPAKAKAAAKAKESLEGAGATVTLK